MYIYLLINYFFFNNKKELRKNRKKNLYKIYLFVFIFISKFDHNLLINI